MVPGFSLARGSRFAAAFLAAGLLAACSTKPDADADGQLGAGGANTPGSIQDFVVNVGDRVFFDSDSSEINGSGQSTLDKQAQWLNRYPRYSFVIEGHADERGTREYNFALGARRAESAKNYLIARGVGGNRIRTTSFGKERPVAVCNDISCWSQNRRAVTVLGGAGG
ncbi:MAG: peptidoglycan-associated lipoprotein [Rhizobiales bacterium PAR1]|nr:MAG: peptidoglycan-associated lipoprotein [Rhizobiales bacterium PAR1]